MNGLICLISAAVTVYVGYRIFQTAPVEVGFLVAGSVATVVFGVRSGILKIRELQGKV